MPPINLDSRTREQFVRRIERIAPETPRRWGKMSAPQMIAHVRRSFAMTFGEMEVPDESNFALRYLVRPVIFSGYVPWPKGKIKAPAGFIVEPGPDFEADRQQLVETILRFCDLSEREPHRVTPHVAFGPLTLRQWRRIHGMHINHHLCQFGQ